MSVTRRNYLKNSVGAGLFATFGLNRNRKTKIPFAKSGDKVVEWREVSKKWDRHRKQVEKVLASKEDELMGPGISGIGIARSKDKIGGGRKFGIEVERDPKVNVTSVESKAVSNKSGVDINVVESDDPEMYCYDNNYDEIKGGATINGEATIACAVEYGGNKRALTARHVVSSDGTACGNVDDNPDEDDLIYQPDDPSSFGLPAEDWENIDTALISHNRNNTKYIFGESQDIEGYVSESGISYKAGHNIGTEGRGHRSCQFNVEIEKYDQTKRIDGCTIENLIAGNSSEAGPGDSGGPVFEPSGYYKKTVYMCGHVTGGDQSQNTVYAPASYALNDKGVIFDW